MKKATTRKRTTPKKSVVVAPSAPVAREIARSSAAQHLPVEEQPQSKEQAATQAGLFLHTDDRWSTAYFDQGDLHCAERELFG